MLVAVQVLTARNVDPELAPKQFMLLSVLGRRVSLVVFPVCTVMSPQEINHVQHFDAVFGATGDIVLPADGEKVLINATLDLPLLL